MLLRLESFLRLYCRYLRQDSVKVLLFIIELAQYLAATLRHVRYYIGYYVEHIVVFRVVQHVDILLRIKPFCLYLPPHFRFKINKRRILSRPFLILYSCDTHKIGKQAAFQRFVVLARHPAVAHTDLPALDVLSHRKERVLEDIRSGLPISKEHATIVCPKVS